MADSQTIKVYDDRVHDYAKMVSKAEPDRALTAFASHLAPSAKVLDLGCGIGNAAAWLSDQGFVVDAFDASAEMVRLANQTHNLNAKQMRFDEFQAQCVYDGIWANFSLLHASRSDFPGHLHQIASALQPGGVFHIGMKLGSGESRDKIGRRYAYYSEPELKEMLQQTGFVVMSQTNGEEPGLSGENWPWITLLSRFEAGLNAE